MYSCGDSRKHLEDLLQEAEGRVRELQEQSKKKTRQIIAIKLQTSTLKYQINKYRNDESGTLDFYLKQNDELRFELTMLKKLRNDEIEHIDSENIDFVVPASPGENRQRDLGVHAGRKRLLGQLRLRVRVKWKESAQAGL